ncbi:hypothetical protein Aam_045_022 [Acidocella aminolytica 101 = DSM 11237]|uniref:Uncharacterized protein n=1 Tax=Acidocella aminolytica 101 = DSM 11237 TaxID=1120923 RepID=A0A0D6PGM1_9PROT|nr:hypothetical protein Aam_045_022 [Acidocella aminolytica 101 = DSM 11237]GBQ42946.1 hypothetical protein AA11237_3121 [Acidocella aminolytica 101 = DSM 11237]
MKQWKEVRAFQNIFNIRYQQTFNGVRRGQLHPNGGRRFTNLVTDLPQRDAVPTNEGIDDGSGIVREMVE